MSNPPKNFFRKLILFILLIGLCSGCTTKAPHRLDPIFIPPAPQVPRLQFLTAIDSSYDVEPENRLMRFLTGSRKPPKLIMKPYGVAIHDGKIYLCDTVLGGIEVIDLGARTFDYWMGEGPGRFKKPLNITFDKRGYAYVADVGRGEVVCFNAEKKYLGAIGTPETLKPTGVAVGGGKLYVTNLLKSRVDVHDANTREYLYSLPKDTDDEKSKLFSPTNIALDPEQNLYVSDTGGFLFKVFDAEGLLMRGFGEAGVGLTQFIRPKGIAVDHQQRVYSVDAATEVVKIFDDQNRLLLFFGRADGNNLPLDLPAGITIDYDHVKLFRKYAAPGFEIEYLVFVINQVGSRKLSVYGYGAMRP